MSSPEQFSTPENSVETPKVSAEQYEHAENAVEKKVEKLESSEKKAEEARVEALENAISVEKGSAEKERPKDSTAPRRRGAISKKEKTASFKRHMKRVQAEMSFPERAFSNVIHSPVIEKTSEFIGATVARPNALLAGAVTAFLLVLAVYITAKNLGYVLSGFETIAAFVVGWIIGILYDYFRVMITGKKN